MPLFCSKKDNKDLGHSYFLSFAQHQEHDKVRDSRKILHYLQQLSKFLSYSRNGFSEILKIIKDLFGNIAYLLLYLYQQNEIKTCTH